MANESNPFEFYPAYISPLTDKEHARIGRIAVLWGQIDFLVERLVCIVTGMSYTELDALQINSKGLASKAGYLKALSKRVCDGDTAEAIDSFCASIDDVKAQRNHVFHGVWGLRCEDRTQTVFAAARKKGAEHAPFRATSLPGLEKRLCACSRLGLTCVLMLYGHHAHTQFNELFHSDDESVDQQWLTQWLERNPLSHDCLDQSAKEGQLPRLKQLRPRK